MKTKIEIKTMMGSVLFSHESEENTLKKTLEKAVAEGAYLGGADLGGAYLRGAYLRGAYLRGAYLRGADLRGADLRDAYLGGADLGGADLRGADLRDAYLGGADLRDAYLGGAYLRGADLRDAYLGDAYLGGAYLGGADLGDDISKFPTPYVNQASRDMLFIFQSLKKELPGLRKALVEGRVDGTQYEGECACLIGTAANLDGSIEEVCAAIPYYDKGTHNPGEAWFLNIHQGDTPKTNVYARHALKLIDMVLKKPVKSSKRKK